MKNTIRQSDYAGVYWSQANLKWLVQVKINGKNVHLGLFDDDCVAYMERERVQSQFLGFTSDVKLAWFKHRKRLKALEKYAGYDVYETGLKTDTMDSWLQEKLMEFGLKLK